MVSQRYLLGLSASFILHLVSAPCYLAAGGPNLHAPAEHAIVVSDLKMDDTGAIHALAHAPETKHVHVVGSNVVNHSAAKGHLDDFMAQMGHPRNKYTYYSGEPLVTKHGVTETHEKNFIGPSSRSEMNSKQVIQQIPPGSSVDLYHIAPAHPSTIHDLVGNKGVNLKTYHHVQGYNSIVQAKGNTVRDADASRDFLATIQEKIKSAHPNADVILTSSRDSFTSKTDGSTQPLYVLKNTFPRNHLDAATKDPFHHRTLNSVEKDVVSKVREGGNIPALHPSGDASKLTEEVVHGALYGGDRGMRSHLTNYVEKALPKVRKSGGVKMTYRLEHGVQKALKDSRPRVEMCDAVHVDACLDARRKKDKDAFRPVRMETQYDPNSQSVALQPKPAHDSAKHGYLLVNRDASQYASRLSPRRG